MPESKVRDAGVKAAQEVAASNGGRTGELLVDANGVTICAEAFGSPKDPAMLLVQGACASMIRWEDDFCDQLADAGRYVIRFDNRDVGRSTAYTPGEPPYDLNDLADDAVGVLDAFGIEKAHFVGASSGGMITQIVGIRHPSRVLTLTLCISTPGVPDVAHAVDDVVNILRAGDGGDLQQHVRMRTAGVLAIRPERRQVKGA